MAEYLDAHGKIGNAAGRLTPIYQQAHHELDEAYQEAQDGTSALVQAVESSAAESFMNTLRGLLLLNEGLRLISKFVVAGFYLSLASVGFMIFGSELGYRDAVDCQNDPSLAKCDAGTGVPSDYVNLSLWQWVLVSFVAVFVLRILFGLWINWLQRRGSASRPCASSDITKPPPLPGHPQPLDAP